MLFAKLPLLCAENVTAKFALCSVLLPMDLSQSEVLSGCITNCKTVHSHWTLTVSDMQHALRWGCDEEALP